MRTRPITPDIEAFLLKAWKQMTITQISVETKVPLSTLSVWFKRKGIEPTTQRDLVAKEIILMHAAGIILKYRPIAEQLNCSQDLVKSIIKEYGLLDDAPMKRGPAKKPVVPNNKTEQFQADALRAYDKHIKETKERRAKFAVYDQYGSELLDELRNIQTSKREQTLASNGRR